LPPEIWPGPGQPAHPIVIPPDAVAPGVPAHPIVLPPIGIWPGPGQPAHPIAPGGPPPGIWPSPGYPAHPIVLPPGVEKTGFTVVVYSHETGEYKSMNFVPGDASPPTWAPGPKAEQPPSNPS
jgi:hypothetical protein